MARHAHSPTERPMRARSRVRQALSFERVFFCIGIVGLLLSALFVVKSYF